MIEDILLQHKLEKERFLSQSYISREKLTSAKKFLEHNLIKVITGPRRSGKSVFSMLLLKDRKFAYLNFDDDNLAKINNTDEIVKAIFQVYPDSSFILFDEIQNLPRWEMFVNKLHRRGHNLVITGSNANLLSKELASVLTGRHQPFEILPFSFKEYLQAKDYKIDKKNMKLPQIQGEILNHLRMYIKNGGFPEIVVQGIDPKSYLETLFDSILFKDVVKRYGLRLSQKIYDLAMYLIANFCCEFSFTKIKNILGFRSTNTVQNYLRYLEEAYLFFPLTRFSYKVKEQIKAPRKIYLIDNGLVLAKSFKLSKNMGRLMENLVFIELLRKGYKVSQDLFYYRTKNGREIDFVLKKGYKFHRLIQVCFDIGKPDTKKRELKAFLEASDELGCEDMLLLSWDHEKEEKIEGKKIKFIPLWKWLVV